MPVRDPSGLLGRSIKRGGNSVRHRAHAILDQTSDTPPLKPNSASTVRPNPRHQHITSMAFLLSCELGLLRFRRLIAAHLLQVTLVSRRQAAQRAPMRTVTSMAQLMGQSGRKYQIQKTLQDKERPRSSVYLVRYVSTQ